MHGGYGVYLFSERPGSLAKGAILERAPSCSFALLGTDRSSLPPRWRRNLHPSISALELNISKWALQADVAILQAINEGVAEAFIDWNPRARSCSCGQGLSHSIKCGIQWQTRYCFAELQKIATGVVVSA